MGALLATGTGRLTLAACALLPLAVVFAGPSLWPGWGRLRGLVLVVPAAAVFVVTGFAALFVAILSLCSSDDGHRYLTTIGAILTLASFALPYALGSAWTVARPRRVPWAWPLVIMATIAIGMAVLALVEGGPHHCYT